MNPPSSGQRIQMSEPVAQSKGTLRCLQLNCLAHWAIDDETAEAFTQRVSLHEEYIRRWQPTVCFLEEVDTAATTLPQGCLSLGQRLLMRSSASSLDKGQESIEYDAVFHQKHNEKGDETWILVNKSEMSFVSHEVLRYDDGTSSQFALIAIAQWHSPAAAAAEGNEKESSRTVLLIATHAKAGRSEEWEAVRVSHSAQLLAHLTAKEEYRVLLERGAVVWGGDLNAGPSSYEGKYPCAWYPHMFHPTTGAATAIGLQSAYVQHSNSEPLFTTIKHRHGALIYQCIDYIFVGKQWKVVFAAPLPSLTDVPPCALPCANWGSDHLPLVVDLQWK